MSITLGRFGRFSVAAVISFSIPASTQKNTAIMPLVGGLPITDISARNACKPVKIACAPSAVSPLLLNAPMPSIVAIPVVKRHIAKVSRLSQRVKMDTWHNRYASAKPR